MWDLSPFTLCPISDSFGMWHEWRLTFIPFTTSSSSELHRDVGWILTWIYLVFYDAVHVFSWHKSYSHTSSRSFLVGFGNVILKANVTKDLFLLLWSREYFNVEKFLYLFIFDFIKNSPYSVKRNVFVWNEKYMVIIISTV